MLDLIEKVLEQFGAFFQLQEKLTSLSNTNPVIATVVVFAISIVVANTILTQIVDLRKKLFKSRSRTAWVALFVAALLAVSSIGVVLNLRKASAPTPELIVDSQTVVGRPLLLKWIYDNPQNSPARFQIQSSEDVAFNEVIDHGYRSRRSTLMGSINGKRYWRIRAVDENHVAVSNWSKSARITQYDSSLKRIQQSQSVSVYISNSYNQGLFEFEASDGKGTLKGYDMAVLDHIISRLPARLNIDGSIRYNPVPVNWEDLLSAPKDGLADIIISTITAISKRENTLSIKFSKPYYCTTQSIIFRPGTPIKSVASMIRNKRVGVQRKTTSEELVALFQGEASESRRFTVVFYNEADEMIDDIVNGKIQFCFTDTPFARAAELQYGTNALNFKELLQDEDFPPNIEEERRTEKYAIAVRAGEEKLIKAINDVIDEMREETLAKFLEEATEEFYRVQKGSRSTPIDGRKDPSRCPSG